MSKSEASETLVANILAAMPMPSLDISGFKPNSLMLEAQTQPLVSQTQPLVSQQLPHQLPWLSQPASLLLPSPAVSALPASSSAAATSISIEEIPKATVASAHMVYTESVNSLIMTPLKTTCERVDNLGVFNTIVSNLTTLNDRKREFAAINCIGYDGNPVTALFIWFIINSTPGHISDWLYENAEFVPQIFDCIEVFYGRDDLYSGLRKTDRKENRYELLAHIFQSPACAKELAHLVMQTGGQLIHIAKLFNIRIVQQYDISHPTSAICPRIEANKWRCINEAATLVIYRRGSSIYYDALVTF